MSITSITIENFKGIRDRVKIDLKPITLLFGPNSGGKSTIIQALHYAWEVIGRHNLDPNFTEFGGREIDLGGFENLVYGHDLSRSISLRFDMDISDKFLPAYTDDPQMGCWYETAGRFDYDNIFCWNINCFTGTHTSDGFIKNEYKPLSSWIEIRISWDHNKRKPYVSTYETGLDNELIAKVKTSIEENKVYISYINFFHRLICSLNQKEIEEAFKKILTQDDEKQKNSEGFTRVHDFMDLIDESYINPESWLDPKLFPPDQYDKLIQLVTSFKEIRDSKEIEKSVEVGLTDFFDEFKDSDKSENEREKAKEKLHQLLDSQDKKIRDYIKAKNNLSSDFDIYAPFLPYEFLFFCKDKLSLKSVTQDFNIGLDQTDALPTWDKDDLLFIDMDLSDEEKYTIGGYSKAIRSALTQFIVGPGQLLKDELNKLSYLGPIRSRIPRNYVPNRYIEKRNWANGLAAWDVLHKEGEEFIKQADNWMSDRLKSGYRISRKSYKEIDASKTTPENNSIIEQYTSSPTKTRLYLIDEKNGIEVQPPDVGVGISQVIPVIVSALYFKDGIMAIEQPELHIHPALQVTLGDLFISRIQEKGLCFLLETHSEHILLRLLRRIRETHENKLPEGMKGLSPDQLKIYYIENAQNGVKITDLEIDETGEFKIEWPHGFFEEREEELFY